MPSFVNFFYFNGCQFFFLQINVEGEEEQSNVNEEVEEFFVKFKNLYVTVLNLKLILLMPNLT